MKTVLIVVAIGVVSALVVGGICIAWLVRNIE